MKANVAEHVTVQTVTENIRMTSDKMTERLHMTSSVSSILPKVSEQPAHEETNLSELYESPGTQTPPHHNAYSKTGQLSDVENYD